MAQRFPRFDRKKGLYLKKTPGKGRGVFCDRDIRAGEVLEVTPAIVLDPRENGRVEDTVLADYAFTAGDSDGASCMIMGIMSFCNHCESPNAEVLWEERNGTLYHTLRATRRIPRHTEICTSYGEGWFDDRLRVKAVKGKSRAGAQKRR